jgi:hypothetical protein
MSSLLENRYEGRRPWNALITKVRDGIKLPDSGSRKLPKEVGFILDVLLGLTQTLQRKHWDLNLFKYLCCVEQSQRIK